MKKLLALVLALVMTLSLATVSSNAAFTDADKFNESYAEAANVLTGMGVLKGYEDGSFKPEGAITRAEVAAVVYRIYTADVTDANVGLYTGYGKFDDLTGANWAKGYIGYCANAGLVKGYSDTKFGPLDNVTGYQALAMILRAMGYDKNGEFTGKDWQLHVAQTAQQLGILVNVGSENLTAAASRQLVAELLFQAIQKDCVSYTPAFGYVPTTVVGAQKSLGAKNFNLKLTENTQDVWGRPSHTWTYKTGDTETVVAQKPVASYQTKVDECDIAKDLGISKSADIESAYIDGVKTNVTNETVTSDRNGKIDPLNTTSLVGAQGRLTEVYKMANGGYRLVEINTYLGVVKTVTAATTDRNGHTTAAKIGVALYLDNTNTSAPTTAVYSFNATGYTVGQYVLVNATRDGEVKVRSVAAATVTPMGLIKTWTPAYGTVAATTTVAETKYNDADKFFLGNFKLGNLTAGANNTTSYDTIVDAYGNLIALVPSTVNYLVIEKIEWKHDNTAIGNGKALADLVLANGEKVANATIASVNGAVTSNTGDTLGAYATAYVSDSYVNNGGDNGYYKHIYTYSVNADGSYALTKYCVTDRGVAQPTHNDTEVSFTQYKTATIGTNNQNRVVANNSTKFLVLDSNGYTYTLYNGINELPSMTVPANGLCYLTDGTYATLVVIKDKTLASSTFVAYAAKQNGYAVGYNPVKYMYNVTKLGSTETTTLYSTIQFQIANDGFYFFKLDANSNIIAADSFEILQAYGAGLDDFGFYSGSTTSAQTVNGLYYDRGLVKAFKDDSLVSGTENYSFYDYRVNESTEYYVVTKTIYSNGTESTEIVKGDINSVSVGDRMIVAYKSDNHGVSENVASYIYVLKTVSDGQAQPTTKGTIEYYVTFKNSSGTVVAENVKVATQVLGEGTYNDVNWTFLSRAMANPTQAPGAFKVENSFVPAANYVNYGCADTYNLVVEAGSTYQLYYTATLIG